MNVTQATAHVRGHSGLDLHSGRPDADPPLTGQDRRDVDHADHASAPSEPAAPHQQETRRSRPGTRAKGLDGPEVAGRCFNDEPLRSQKSRWEIRSCFHPTVLLCPKPPQSHRHARSLLKMKTWVNSLPHPGRSVIQVTRELMRPNSVVDHGGDTWLAQISRSRMRTSLSSQTRPSSRRRVDRAERLRSRSLL